MPPKQQTPDESGIVKEPTPLQNELATLSVEEWVETVLMPRRREILTELANKIYIHNIQKKREKQQAQEQAQENGDEQAD